MLYAIGEAVVDEKIRGCCERHAKNPFHLGVVVAVGIIVGVLFSTRRAVVGKLVYDGVVGVFANDLQGELVAHIFAKICVGESAVGIELLFQLAVASIIVLWVGGDGDFFCLLYFGACGG